MFLFWIEENKNTPGPDINIDCPACELRGVAASTFEHQLRNWYLGFIPVPASKITCVTCMRCRTALNSKVPLTGLFDKTPKELAALRYVPTTSNQQLLAFAALVFSWVPFAGFGLSVIATAVNWRVRGWPKVFSLIALGLSTLLVIVFGVGMVLEKIGLLK